MRGKLARFILVLPSPAAGASAKTQATPQSRRVKSAYAGSSHACAASLAKVLSYTNVPCTAMSREGTAPQRARQGRHLTRFVDDPSLWQPGQCEQSNQHLQFLHTFALVARRHCGSIAPIAALPRFREVAVRCGFNGREDL